MTDVCSINIKRVDIDVWDIPEADDKAAAGLSVDMPQARSPATIFLVRHADPA